MPRCADDYRTARSGFAPTKRWAKRHLVDLAQPDHAPAGGQLVAVLNLIMPGLPSGRSVIALWEVDEVARTRSLPHAARAHQTQPIISETCPPGEGALLCSWDGPLACQALTAQHSRPPSGAYMLVERPSKSAPIRAPSGWLSLS